MQKLVSSGGVIVASMLSVVLLVRQRIRWKWERPGLVFVSLAMWWGMVNTVSLVSFLSDAAFTNGDRSISFPEAWFGILMVAVASLIVASILTVIASVVLFTQQVIAHRRNQ